MTTILIHVENEENPALYVSHAVPGGKVRFVSEIGDEVTITFSAGSPFEREEKSFPLTAGETLDKQVRENAPAGGYPFKITGGPFPEGEEARIVVGESAADKVGFRIAKVEDKACIVYQVIFTETRTGPSFVRLDNHTDQEKSLHLQHRELMPRNPTVLRSKEVSPLEPLTIDAEGLAFTVNLDPIASASSGDGVLNVGQGGGTMQVEIIVDPEEGCPPESD